MSTNSNTTVVPPAEALAQDWEAARSYHSATITHARLTAAAMILTGWKLGGLKKALGFTGSGRRKKKSAHDEHFLSWPEWLEQELPGMTRPTADRWIDAANVIKKRLADGGEKRAVRILENGPKSARDQEFLEKLINKVTDGETIADVFRSAEIAKLPHRSTTGGHKPGDGNDAPEPTMQQLALGLFTDPLIRISRLRAHGDYRECLHALALTSDDPDAVTLTTLESQTEALLHDVRDAKAEAMQTARKS